MVDRACSRPATADLVTVLVRATWLAISRIEALSSSAAAETVCELPRAWVEAAATACDCVDSDRAISDRLEAARSTPWVAALAVSTERPVSRSTVSAIWCRAPRLASAASCSCSQLFLAQAGIARPPPA